MSNEINSGWFIKFTPDEKQFETDLDEYLKEGEYSPAPDGIKELLHDTIYEDDEKKEKPNVIIDAIQNNPEAVQQTIQGVGTIFSKLVNAKIFKK